MEKIQNYGSGISFSGILGIVFLVLKLTHVIDWSWWWVLAPFWGPLVLACLLFLLVFISLVIKTLKNK